MSGTDLLGEFERLVLLAILQSEERHALQLRKRIEEATDRPVSRGALYRTLDRLEGKGLVRWRLEDVGEAWGGHPRKVFEVTEPGVEALRRSHSVIADLSAGLEAILEGS